MISTSPSLVEKEPSSPVVLCVGGWDPSGGAGLAADIKAVQSLGGHALAVPTAVVVENTDTVWYSKPHDPALIEDQFNILLADFDIQAVKVGLVATPAQWSRLELLRRRLPGVPWVVDPVTSASHGQALVAATSQRMALAEWLSRIAVSTPNAKELMELTGTGARPATEEEWIHLARSLIRDTTHAVVLTGGHHQGPLRHRDLLVTRDRHERNDPPTPLRWPERDFHGTGCLFASAMAVHMARGAAASDAARAAKAWVTQRLNAQPSASPAKSGRLVVI